MIKHNERDEGGAHDTKLIIKNMMQDDFNRI